MADLGRWLNEEYRVPGGNADEWPRRGPGGRDTDDDPGTD